jgi:hypothetical protein
MRSSTMSWQGNYSCIVKVRTIVCSLFAKDVPLLPKPQKRQSGQLTRTRMRMNKLFLMLIRHIVAQLELCVVDYQNGGFLPREKRALQPIVQKRIGKLAEKMAHFKIVQQDNLLKHKLIKLSQVLQN